MGFSIGFGVGITMQAQGGSAFAFADVADLLLLDASQETGLVDGVSIPSVTDRAAGAHHYTQATGAAQPTYAATWAGNSAYAFNGSQFASTASGIISGQAAWSMAWVGEFDNVAGAHTAIFFGTNATDGLDWNANRNAGGKFGCFARTVGAIDTDLAADTDPHRGIITYNAAATPKWHIYIDGVERTLSDANVVPADPSALSVIGATNTVPQLQFTGKQALVAVGTGVWDVTTRGNVDALITSIWTGLP